MNTTLSYYLALKLEKFLSHDNQGHVVGKTSANGEAHKPSRQRRYAGVVFYDHPTKELYLIRSKTDWYALAGRA